MNTFDATAGAFDALLAIAIYSGVVFGFRALVHRKRNTEPNPANNKWMWLTALGLAAVVFVTGGSAFSDSETGATEANGCSQIHSAYDQYEGKLAAAGSVREKNYVLLQASYLVGNSPNCFTPSDVASAQAFITSSK